MLFQAISVLFLSIGGPAAPQPAQLSLQTLHFIENCGQWDAGIRFAARCREGSARIESDGFVFAARSGASVSLRFEGAREDVVFDPHESVPAVYSFFLGRNPERWRGGVRAHRRVRAAGLYEGVDIEYREGDERGVLEYDLHVEDSTSLDRIVVRCEGATGLELEPDGALRIRTEAGDLRQSPPSTWQVGPGGEKLAVLCRYRIVDRERFGFEASLFDSALPVVIDPALNVFSFVGTEGLDRTLGIAKGLDSEVYVAGMSDGFGFTVPAGQCVTFEGNPEGGRNALVARIDPLGEITAVAILGGTSDDEAVALHVDPDFGVSVCGYTSSENFPATNGSSYKRGAGSFIPGDGFVARLSLDLCSLTYSTFLGGERRDGSHALGVNAKGQIAVLGFTASPDFPTTPGALMETFRGGAYDSTLSLIDPTRGGALKDQLVYSTFFGGRDTDSWDLTTSPENDLNALLALGGLAIDAEGRVAITGQTRSPDFPITQFPFQTRLAGGLDAWAAIIVPDVEQEQLVWSTLIGGREHDTPKCLALGSEGGVWIAGETFVDFPTTTNARLPAAVGLSDGFVAHFNPNLKGKDQLVYSTFVGGSGWEYVNDIAVSPSGLVAFVGDCDTSAGIAPTRGAIQESFAGFWDGFLVVLNPRIKASDQVLYSTFAGGGFIDTAACVLFDGTTAWLAGETWSSEFKPFPGVTSSGGRDGYALRLDLRLPQAEFTVNATGCEFTFDAAATTTPDGTVIVSYTWEFSDGATAEGPAARRTFPPGRHTVVLTVTNDIGLMSTRTTTVSCACGSSDAAPWKPIDIGVDASGIPGSAFFIDPARTSLEVCAGGKGLSGTKDGIHFDYQELIGDGALVARLTALDGEPSASIGLMLREDLDPGSRLAAILVQKGEAGETCRYYQRPMKDKIFPAPVQCQEPPAIPDAWLMLERKGNTVIGSVSKDGSDWREVGRKEFAAPLSPLPLKLYGGICAGGLDDSRSPFSPLRATLSDLSSTFPVSKALFRRGDADSNSAIDLTDAVNLLNHLFLGNAQPACLEAADFDDNGEADISDAIASLNYQFLGAAPPAAPGPTTCGEDQNEPFLACDAACQ